jgi:hypothetical protein
MRCALPITPLAAQSIPFEITSGKPAVGLQAVPPGAM